MPCYTEEWLLLLLAWEQNPPLTRLVVVLQQYWEKDMPTQQQRRKSERMPSMRACPYELTRPVDANAMMLTAGHAYSINCSAEGILLLLPGVVAKRHVFEVQVPSEARETQITKLGEVCWTRSIPVNSGLCMYLVGIRFLFELPALG
jgi:hypothetical protein